MHDPLQADPTVEQAVAAAPTGETTEDVLVEDVSIDGMCGVY